MGFEMPKRVDEEIDFPKEYWGEVLDSVYHPNGVPRSQYHNPTVELTLRADKPPFKKHQRVFLPVPIDENGEHSTIYNVRTYTGAFIDRLRTLGWTPNKPCPNVLQVLLAMKGIKGELERTKVGEKTQGDKWIFRKLGTFEGTQTNL